MQVIVQSLQRETRQSWAVIMGGATRTIIEGTSDDPDKKTFVEREDASCLTIICWTRKHG